jgi:alpha-ribazole phosphatase
MNKITNQEQRLRLYLIRHGEVEGAADGRLLGRTDPPLSERGLEQSRELAELLSTLPISVVYSSDLQRARMTADAIARRGDLKVKESPAWREIDMGEWEGRTIAALHHESPELLAQVFNNPASFQYRGGESFASFTARVQTAISQLLLTHKSGDVALVAHGGVCRTIIGGVLGLPMQNWLRLAQGHACLNVIEWYGVNPILLLLNCQNPISRVLVPN